MRKAGFAVSGFACAILCLAPAGPVWAQDPVKVAPEVYKVRLENEKVRVLEIHVKPGSKSATHSHPAHVVLALSPCKIKFTLPDGKTNVTELKSGDVVWNDPTTHSAENVGSAECHATNVELKGTTGQTATSPMK